MAHDYVPVPFGRWMSLCLPGMNHALETRESWHNTEGCLVVGIQKGRDLAVDPQQGSVAQKIIPNCQCG